MSILQHHNSNCQTDLAINTTSLVRKTRSGGVADGALHVSIRRMQNRIKFRVHAGGRRQYVMVYMPQPAAQNITPIHAFAIEYRRMHLHSCKDDLIYPSERSCNELGSRCESGLGMNSRENHVRLFMHYSIHHM